MRVLICGDRNWTDDRPIYAILEGLLEESIVDFDFDLVIIEGCANGADKIAHCFSNHECRHAEHDQVSHEHYPANWQLYGKAAGPIRNEKMLREGRPDVVYGFHDNIAKSKGTHDMLVRASHAGIPTFLVSHFS